MTFSRRGLIALAAFAALQSSALAAEEVNVYSYRQPELINPLFEQFTRETGIAVKTVFADKGLVERMEQEGTLSPADLLMSADVGRLVIAAEKGLAQPVDLPAILDKVPAALRDTGNLWFGLTMRARVVYASKDGTEVRMFVLRRSDAPSSPAPTILNGSWSIPEVKKVG